MEEESPITEYLTVAQVEYFGVGRKGPNVKVQARLVVKERAVEVVVGEGAQQKVVMTVKLLT